MQNLACYNSAHDTRSHTHNMYSNDKEVAKYWNDSKANKELVRFNGNAEKSVLLCCVPDNSSINLRKNTFVARFIHRDFFLLIYYNFLIRRTRIAVCNLKVRIFAVQAKNNEISFKVLRMLELVDRVRYSHINGPGLLVSIRQPMIFPLIDRNTHKPASTFYRHVMICFCVRQCVAFRPIVAGIWKNCIEYLHLIHRQPYYSFPKCIPV